MITSWIQITAIVSATLFAAMAITTALHGDKNTRREMSLWALSMTGLVLAPFYNTVPETHLGYLGVLIAYTLANAVVITSAALLFRLFENSSLWSPLYIALALLTLGLDTFDYSLSLYQNWPNKLSLIIWFEYLPQVLKVGFISVCFWALLKSWRVDLVNRRYHLRYFLIFSMLLIGAEMLLFENLLAVRFVLPYQPQAFHSAWQLLLALSLMLGLFQPTDALSRWLTSKSETPEDLRLVNTISFEAKRLQTLLTEQEVFRDPRLNLNTLATMMDMPVYRLRDLIHNELNYQNFNTYLNDYRIRAACLDLKDINKQSQSITTIALDSGFGSLAPFNRAFKLIIDQTPSQYRKNNSNNQPTKSDRKSF